jgi:hypothetical protein
MMNLSGLHCCSLQRMAHVDRGVVMQQRVKRVDSAWRKSRLAARLLLRKEVRPLTTRQRTAARELSADLEVTNRLIQQALYYLGIGERKDAFDRKLVERQS